MADTPLPANGAVPLSTATVPTTAQTDIPTPSAAAPDPPTAPPQASAPLPTAAADATTPTAGSTTAPSTNASSAASSTPAALAIPTTASVTKSAAPIPPPAGPTPTPPPPAQTGSASPYSTVNRPSSSGSANTPVVQSRPSTFNRDVSSLYSLYGNNNNKAALPGGQGRGGYPGMFGVPMNAPSSSAAASSATAPAASPSQSTPASAAAAATSTPASAVPTSTTTTTATAVSALPAPTGPSTSHQPATGSGATSAGSPYGSGARNMFTRPNTSLHSLYGPRSTPLRGGGYGGGMYGHAQQSSASPPPPATSTASSTSAIGSTPASSSVPPVGARSAPRSVSPLPPPPTGTSTSTPSAAGKAGSPPPPAPATAGSPAPATNSATAPGGGPSRGNPMAVSSMLSGPGPAHSPTGATGSTPPASSAAGATALPAPAAAGGAKPQTPSTGTPADPAGTAGAPAAPAPAAGAARSASANQRPAGGDPNALPKLGNILSMGSGFGMGWGMGMGSIPGRRPMYSHMHQGARGAAAGPAGGYGGEQRGAQGGVGQQQQQQQKSTTPTGQTGKAASPPPPSGASPASMPGLNRSASGEKDVKPDTTTATAGSSVTSGNPAAAATVAGASASPAAGAAGGVKAEPQQRSYPPLPSAFARESPYSPWPFGAGGAKQQQQQQRQQQPHQAQDAQSRSASQGAKTGSAATAAASTPGSSATPAPATSSTQIGAASNPTSTSSTPNVANDWRRTTNPLHGRQSGYNSSPFSWASSGQRSGQQLAQQQQTKSQTTKPATGVAGGAGAAAGAARTTPVVPLYDRSHAGGAGPGSSTQQQGAGATASRLDPFGAKAGSSKSLYGQPLGTGRSGLHNHLDQQHQHGQNGHAGNAADRHKRRRSDGGALHDASSGGFADGKLKTPKPAPFTQAQARKADIRSPLVQVDSESVFSAVKSVEAKRKGEAEKQFLGRFVYDPKVEPAKLLDGKLLADGVGGVVEVAVDASWLEGCEYQIGSPAEYEGEAVGGKDDSPLRIPAEMWELEPLQKRKVWGTDVYTDDSDVLAMCLHSGWLRVTPKSAGDAVASLPPASAASSTAGTQENKAILSADKPTETLLVTLRVSPALLRYQGSSRQGLESRSWGNGHDGVSLYIQSIAPLKERVTRHGRRWLKVRAGQIATRLSKKAKSHPHAIEPFAPIVPEAASSSTPSAPREDVEMGSSSSTSDDTVSISDTFILSIEPGRGSFVLQDTTSIEGVRQKSYML